ncbi:PP2C family protein-serine/threonine phosphatase [Actinomadura sp. WMMB 499]|uniref:PP2C family protein-serine/threonine phosphatase n=1 Tax=Actinomadura sp. WMMB 499 TaxID=1219491 RepID=UPI001243CD48|nr:GAF domain-containing SpoIIE family protein phosphatase [Actinomadura sp. WMMB 499]QFG23326.1 SpoIIE family protein phosphatase [Actinomadura sp. WMMB 499]
MNDAQLVGPDGPSGVAIAPAARHTTDTGGPEDEIARLRAVRRYEILDSPREVAFDRVAALAARLIGAPIATVTFVDQDRVWFKAAHGVDGLEQVGREPGLCASAVLQDAPYVVHDAAADARTEHNPLVHGGLGLGFYAAAPITTPDGLRLGTLNVMDRRPRFLSTGDVQTLRDLAGVVMDELEFRLAGLRAVRMERMQRAAAEDHAHRLEEQKRGLQELAVTLQRSLLPPRLAQVPHCTTAALYRPASEFQVSGDFYDLFPIDRGERWGLLIGDVVGKGPRAATYTSLARHTLRTAAATGASPAEALSVLDAAIAADSETGDEWFCTAVFATLVPRPGRLEMTIAGGGHPPAIVLRADGSVETCPRTGPIIGCLPGAAFTETGVTLGPGEAVVLYTDGLTDALHLGTRFSEEALVDYVAAGTRRDAASIGLRLESLIQGFDEAREDDIAALAIGVAEEA